MANNTQIEKQCRKDNKPQHIPNDKSQNWKEKTENLESREKVTGIMHEARGMMLHRNHII